MRMKGHIRQRSKGSWTIVVDIGKNPVTGKRRQQWQTIKGTKRDAERELRKLLESLEAGSYIKPTRLTLGEWLNRWWQSYVSTHTSPRTADSYRAQLLAHIIPSLGGISLRHLQPQQLQSYYAEMLSNGRMDGKGGLSARTVLYQHRILSEALSHAVRMDLIARNVAEAVAPPRASRHRMNTLAPEDLPRFLEAAQDTPYYVLFFTAVYTGMRLGELLGLRWCDVDLDMASIHVVQALYKRCGICKMVEPKSAHSRRQIAMSPSLALLLRQYKADQSVEAARLGKHRSDNELVFCYLDGSPLDSGVVSKALGKVLSKAGLPHIRFHDLRHTHATFMLKSGVHPKIVSERLGHASITITLDTYSHVLPGLQEAAAERLDKMLEPDVSKMLASQLESDSEAHRARTCNRLIKSQLLYLLS
jgi:integrase